MVVIIGLVTLLFAVATLLVGTFANSGSNHVAGDFGIVGMHINNASTGMVFLYGGSAGVIGMIGLSLLWGAFKRRLASGGMRRKLKDNKEETENLRQERDRLNRELEKERDGHLGEVAPGSMDNPSITD